MKPVVVLAVFLLFVFVLTACATGVAMTEQDKAACLKSGCTAWTDTEIGQLISKIYRLGYTAGVKSL